VAPAKCNGLAVYRLRVGDVVMGRRGEMGRCAIVTAREHGFLCGTGSLFIRPNDVLTSTYLKATLSTASMRRRLEHASLGVTLPNLNRGIVAGLEIPLPPISAQQEFARRLGAVGLLQRDLGISCATVEGLFASLQHRAFRGEL
jgi:type I restriction enzyme S subunit